jgi:hypothetical protein
MRPKLIRSSRCVTNSPRRSVRYGTVSSRIVHSVRIGPRNQNSFFFLAIKHSCSGSPHVLSFRILFSSQLRRLFWDLMVLPMQIARMLPISGCTSTSDLFDLVGGQDAQHPWRSVTKERRLQADTCKHEGGTPAPPLLELYRYHSTRAETWPIRFP